MRIALFYHSLISDWNHGNAHFLRGIVSELLSRGHCVAVYEPRDAWSLQNLVQEQGDLPIRQFRKAYPLLESIRYDREGFDPASALRAADLVIVHEWNDHDLVARIGSFRRKHGGFRLLFHDTHHRSVTDSESMAGYDLSGFDGVLAYGSVIRDLYLSRGWASRAWTWHEAADVRVFRPIHSRNEGDLVWIGNWGDDERTEELQEFLIEPVRALGLRARVYGVRYPEPALRLLERAGIEYGGWLPNFEVPTVFSRFSLTVHVPRRPYVQALPGIPTIRPFEAMACGIPLVSSPWTDAEKLFTAGRDFLYAADGTEMTEILSALLKNPGRARMMAEHARGTILERHTCGHRVDELMAICRELGMCTEERSAAGRAE
ncbi:MAG TPA: glycosyltransferase [Verrucomicrobiae bacterium]|nr:glycosyltransferase [Verrucomicrobiae bacterium]